MNSVETRLTSSPQNLYMEEDFFDQVQRCAEENQRKLKQAKNLEDLIKIKLSTTTSQNSKPPHRPSQLTNKSPTTATIKGAQKSTDRQAQTSTEKPTNNLGDKKRKISDREMLLDMMNRNENQLVLSDSEEENHIFGKGIADRIARLPGVSYDDEKLLGGKPNSRYKHSYLSSIQSIRGIEKEKLNEALQKQVNKLTIINEKFKQIIAPSAKNVRNFEKYLSADRKSLYHKPSPNSSLRKPKKNQNDNFNLIKFCNTKNTDFLFGSKEKLKAMKPRRVKLKPKNQDLHVPIKESTNSEILGEMEHTFDVRKSSSDEEPSKFKVPIKVPHQQNLGQQYHSTDRFEKGSDKNEYERLTDSRASQKPARVVFKKASKDISRAERVNQMAHLDYIESELNNTQNSFQAKTKSKPKVNPKFYSQMNKKRGRKVAHSEAKSMTVGGFQPLNLNKFSPKRFRRFPRFTIFLNKDQENAYEKENSISLNPQFLNFLMTPEKAEIIDQANSEFDEAMRLLNTQNLKKFDPFDRVILSAKGIDNSILTSLRTLAKLNNSISESFKVIHTKFAPYQLKNPRYANKKEVPQAEKNLGVNPPIDLSTFAEDQIGRAFSMGPFIKGVSKHMFKSNDFSPDLPQIDENPPRSYKPRGKGVPFTNKIVNEVNISKFNLTSRYNFECNFPQSPLNQESNTFLNATSSTFVEKKKTKKGRGGGFLVNNNNRKRRYKPSTSTTDDSHNKDLTGDYTKKDYAHLLGEINVRNDPPGKRISRKKSSSMIPTDESFKNSVLAKVDQTTVRGLIDKMYQKEKKYIKQYYKEDFIQQNDFIFNLNKTHQLRLAKGKNSVASLASTPSEINNFGL
ncbi:unnamed protein product [Moneuplotes crassus]|uniref:Uncharacterized protein n=1 Tax=Euplotes crassus TaxID=5936 RepID=A0AAD1XYC6_EUPCR|nr:unnamed protein product [Moneuplotes crassus]